LVAPGIAFYPQHDNQNASQAARELIARDYYCIPYKAVMQMLDEAYLVHDAKNAPSR
jgi:hypothetical protein